MITDTPDNPSLKGEDPVQQVSDLGLRDGNFSVEIECQKPPQTLLTQNKVEIVINEYESRNQGLFQSAYVAFKIETKPLGWCVWRRFSDIAWLRNTLQKAFPCTLIPPIPRKKM